MSTSHRTTVCDSGIVTSILTDASIHFHASLRWHDLEYLWSHKNHPCMKESFTCPSILTVVYCSWLFWTNMSLEMGCCFHPLFGAKFWMSLKCHMHSPRYAFENLFMNIANTRPSHCLNWQRLWGLSDSKTVTVLTIRIIWQRSYLWRLGDEEIGTCYGCVFIVKPCL